MHGFSFSESIDAWTMNAQIRTIFIYACTKIKSRRWLGVTVQFTAVLDGPAVFAGPLITYLIMEKIYNGNSILFKRKQSKKKERLYIAKVVSPVHANMDDVVDRMMSYGFGNHRSDAKRVLAYFQEALEAMLIDGACISTPFARFMCSIRGEFRSLEDSFDPARHQLYPVVNPGKKLRVAFREKAQARKKHR